MIRHHLKDGKVVKSIEGHVVKKEDVPLAYYVINIVNQESRKQI